MSFTLSTSAIPGSHTSERTWQENHHNERLAFVDTWRSIAIALVIISHVVGNRGIHGQAMIPGTYGQTGVFIFFFISGLVVSKTCISEHAQYDDFSIPAFYVRRIFRIVPPLVLYMCSCLALHYLGIINLDPRNFIGVSVYTCNISIVNCGWYGGQAWSLAFEEQFYLLFPILFTAIEIDSRAALKMVFVLPLSILPFIFSVNWIGKTGFIVIYALFLAGYLASRYLKSVVILLRSPWFFLIWPISIIVVFFPIYASGNLAMAKYGKLLYTVAIPVMVLGTGMRGGILARIFSTAWLARLGRATYSMYLWQQLFTGQYFSQLDLRRQTTALAGMTIGCVILYELMERRLIRIGRQISDRIRSRQPGAVHLKPRLE